MKDEIAALEAAMEAHGYIADRAIATALFLSKEMRRPLLIEGDAGVGKTEIAKVLARLLDTELIRLQCYEGLDVSDEADGLAALTLIDLGDREEVRLALKTALKIRPRDAEVFEELFALLWSPGEAEESRKPARAMAAALPYVDRLLPAHNLESLERLLPLLTS